MIYFKKKFLNIYRKAFVALFLKFALLKIILILETFISTKKFICWKEFNLLHSYGLLKSHILDITIITPNILNRNLIHKFRGSWTTFTNFCCMKALLQVLHKFCLLFQLNCSHSSRYVLFVIFFLDFKILRLVASHGGFPSMVRNLRKLRTSSIPNWANYKITFKVS